MSRARGGCLWKKESNYLRQLKVIGQMFFGIDKRWKFGTINFNNTRKNQCTFWILNINSNFNWYKFSLEQLFSGTKGSDLVQPTDSATPIALSRSAAMPPWRW